MINRTHVMNAFRRLTLVPLIAFGLLSILATGGGGGSNPPPPLPPPSADITTTNATALADDVIGSAILSSAFSAASVDGATPDTSTSGVGAVHILLRLSAVLNKTLDKAETTATTQRFTSSQIPIDVTEPCLDGGTVRYVGTLNENGTGTLTLIFDNCREGDDILDGTATLRVDAVTPSFDPIDSTFSFSSLTFLSPTFDLTLDGSVRSQISGNTETLTSNITLRDNMTGDSITTQNFVISISYNNISFPSSFSLSISGRIVDSRFGSFDVIPITPLEFAALDQLFANSGQFLIVGASNRKIRVTAVSALLVKLELDLDGDDVFETAASLRWDELETAVGADLADDDGDGIHNSWETFYGLNPSDPADAGVDSDGDGSSNLQEYEAGTDPTNPLSGPPTADLAITNTDAPDPVTVGANVIYTIQVTNLGAANATDVVVTDPLPPTLIFVGVTTTRGSCFGSTTITCNLGSLSSGSVATISLTVSASVEGLHNNTASVTSATPDPTSTNNSATATTSVGTLISGLQAMIDAANPGDTIVVPAGFYIGGLDFNGKDITLVSSDGPAATIINGNSGTAVRMGPGGTIMGFTITGAVASFGAGIEVSGAGSLIARNVFDGNLQSAGGHGAAIGGNSASPTIEQNVFRNNSCDNQFSAGVVAFVNFSSPLIVNNIFENNPCRAINLSLPEGNTPVVINNTFVGNRTGIRADRRVSLVAQTYRNNIVVQNDIGLELEFGTEANNPVWENNLVFGNTVDYQGTADKTGTAGNISADPLFVNLVGGDYHLQTDSPAIDAGSVFGAPAVDFDGTARPLDGDGDTTPITDIGAFEAPQLVIDQQQPIIDSAILAIGGASEQKFAQVVTAGGSGALTEVRLPVFCSTGNDLIVEIQGVSGNIPSGVVLTSQTIPGASLPSFSPDPPSFRSLVFSAPVFVSAGSPFAIVLRSAGSCGVFHGPIGDPYPGGDGFFNALPDGVWVSLGMPLGTRSDLPFQTLVDPNG